MKSKTNLEIEYAGSVGYNLKRIHFKAKVFVVNTIRILVFKE